MTDLDGAAELEARLRHSEERLRLGEAASGVATFEFDRANWKLELEFASGASVWT